MDGTYREMAGTTIEDQTKKTNRTDSSGDIIHNGKRVLQNGKTGGIKFAFGEKGVKIEELTKNDIVARLFWFDLDKKHTEIIEDGIIYISTVPEMPKVDLRLEVPPSYFMQNLMPVLPFCAVLEIEYKVDKDGKKRNDVQRYPIDPQYSINVTPTAETPIFFSPAYFMKNKDWENKNVVFNAEILPRYNNIFRGGKATLKIYSDKNQNNLVKMMVFHIRGKNPTKQQVRDYLTEKGYLTDYWFINKMIIHESFSQSLSVIQQFNDTSFNKKITIGKDCVTEIGGIPYFGKPDGWGAGQLDYSSNVKSKNLNILKTAPSNTLWHWKKNIDLLIVRLVKEKVTAMKSYEAIKNNKGHIIEYLGIPGKVGEFKKENPKLDVTSFSSEKKEGLVNFINCETLIPVISDLNIYMNKTRNSERSDNGQIVKSLLDAHLIRSYNGGRFLYKLSKNKDNSIIWEINDTSSESGNYVEKVCSINE